MKRTFWIATSIIALGFAGAAATRTDELHDIAARTGPNPLQTTQQEHDNRRPVLVMTVRASRGANALSLPGVIAARTEETRAFQVGGRLVERRVSLGDIVRKGEILARLDDSDFRLALEAAEAERAAATAAFDKARVDLGRITSLESGGWASNRASDDAEIAFEEARARLERARRAEMLARNQLDYATIRADAGGVVTREFAEAGQVIAPGQPILRIARDAGREAIVAVPEARLSDIRDRRAVVELWSQDGTEIPARLVELSPVADPVTRTFEARYRLDDITVPPALGMSVTVRLTGRDPAETTEIPLSAMHYGAEGPSVWAVTKTGRLETRPVSVAGIGAKTVRIGSGLRDGERIVVIGTHKLSAGETVRPIQQEG